MGLGEGPSLLLLAFGSLSIPWRVVPHSSLCLHFCTPFSVSVSNLPLLFSYKDPGSNSLDLEPTGIMQDDLISGSLT